MIPDGKDNQTRIFELEQANEGWRRECVNIERVAQCYRDCLYSSERTIRVLEKTIDGLLRLQNEFDVDDEGMSRLIGDTPTEEC